MNPFFKNQQTPEQANDHNNIVDFIANKPTANQPITRSKPVAKAVKEKSPSYILKGDALPLEIRIGYWAIAAFIVILLVWVASIPLASGAIAPGVVSVSGSSKVVQHLNGGRIIDILIKEGDLVQKGEVLIKLDETQLQEKYHSLKSLYILLLSRKSRLQAESNGLSKIVYANWLQERMNDAQVVEAINNQERIFNSNISLLHEKETTYRHRINQAQTLISSDQSRLSTTHERANNINVELNQYQKLLRKGLVTRNQTFSLENSKNEVNSQVYALTGSIQSNKSRVSQLKAEVSEYKILQKNKAVKELDTLQDKIASTNKDLSLTRYLLAQTTIKAPIEGYIVNLKAKTIGGIIASGQEIMGIVPNNKSLMVLARVDVKDRDTIKVGLDADVRFSAFNRRTTLPIKGRVVVVSADRTVDALTNISYYNTKIELLEDPSVKLHGSTIYPGMLAEVIIQTGERTVSDYFLAPILSSFNKALREK